ncbi:MAG TPA: hypothetical protein PLK76_01845 [bacterium]|nr:hypothetical protein [bacterium]
MKKKKNLKKINLWQKPFSRLSILVLIMVLSWLSLSIISQTLSFFRDTEKAVFNDLTAGSLDLSLNTNDLGQIFLDQEFELHLAQAGNLPFQYSFKIETDDIDFCNNLILNATSSDLVFYSNYLQNFTATATTISDLFDSWQFKITSPLNYPTEQTCNFKFTFQAWQTDEENYDSESGFSDEEIVTGRVENSSGSGGAECIQVSYPNGGEVWWVGRTHEIGWETNNPIGYDEDLKIDIYYSNDSGQSWGLIKTGAPNLGQYFWRVSLMLENNTYWVASAKARIKLVARYSNGEICGVDTSDADYCPPIEYDLLTLEELAWLKTHDLLEEPVNPITLETDETEGVENEIQENVETPELIENENMTLIPIAESNISDEPLEFTPLIEPEIAEAELTENIEEIEAEENLESDFLELPSTLSELELPKETSEAPNSEEILEILIENTQEIIPAEKAPICLNTENIESEPIEEIQEPTPIIVEPEPEVL